MRKLALIGATVVGAVVLSASPVSVKWSAERNLSVSQDKAFAVVGRPGTPRSVAGVARRTERRAIRRDDRSRSAMTKPNPQVRDPAIIASNSGTKLD
jgi:hypothetical protein